MGGGKCTERRMPRRQRYISTVQQLARNAWNHPERGKRWLKYRGRLKVCHHTDHWAIIPQPPISTLNQRWYIRIYCIGVQGGQDYPPSAKFSGLSPTSKPSLHSAHVWYIAQESSITCITFSYSKPIYYAKKSDLVTGETYFVDLIRGLKWLQHQDNNGAYYYFCEDDRKSLWELPVLDGLLIAKGQVMYGKQEGTTDDDGEEHQHQQWCRRIIALEKTMSNLHILRTNFRCETAVSREISLNILDTPTTQWTRTSSHILNLRCRSSSSSTSSLDINIKFDAREDLVEWLSQLKLDFCHTKLDEEERSEKEVAQTTSQTHPIQGNWIIDFFDTLLPSNKLAMLDLSDFGGHAVLPTF